MNAGTWAAAKLYCIMLAAALALGCGEGKTQKHTARVGGCESDTIRLGLRMERGHADSPAYERIAIRAVRDAGSETFTAAALDLTAILDSLGVTIYRRSDLVHISRGACWPPYHIDFLVRLGSRTEAESVYSALKSRPVAGLSASAERPARYGIFFITASSGSSDLWTAWYDSAR